MVCGHVSMLCRSQDKKGRVYVYRGGRVVSTGHIIFRERDQNGPAALWHGYLRGKWNFGRAPSAGWPRGSLIVVSAAASCISMEDGRHRNPALNSRTDDYKRIYLGSIAVSSADGLGVIDHLWWKTSPAPYLL